MYIYIHIYIYIHMQLAGLMTLSKNSASCIPDEHRKKPVPGGHPARRLVQFLLQFVHLRARESSDNADCMAISWG